MKQKKINGSQPPYSRRARPVLVVGSVAIDKVLTPQAQSDRMLGGSASYGAIASSYFAPTRLLAVVGGDFSRHYIRRLQRRQIDLTGLGVEPQGKTFYWSGEYAENFNHCTTLEIDLNVFDSFQPVLPAEYRATPFVMLGAIHPDLQHHVLDQIGPDAFVLADTRDFWIKSTHDSLLKLLKRVDLFVLNDSEAALLSGVKNMIVAGARIKKMGPRVVVIKKGEHGSLLFHPEGFFALPAFPVTRLQDPTGAGDSYAGALLGYLASVNRTDLMAVRRGLAYATAAASLTVESFGCARLESAGRSRIDARVEELRRLTRL